MLDRTHDAIFKAFNELVAKNSFDNISVNDICEKAQVSRSTFYRYFVDKYDVMNHNYRIMFHECVSVSHNYEELFCHLFLYSKENLPAIRRVFNTAGVNSFSEFIAEESVRFVEELTKKKRNGKGFSEVERMQAEIIGHGIGFIAKRWIDGEYDLSPEESAHALYMLIPEQFRYETF